MSRRRLAPDEVELWRRVAASARPLHPDRKGVPSAAPTPPEAPRKNPAPLRPFEIGSKARNSAPAAPPPSKTTQIDARMQKRLRRGRLSPEARIDLHGMTLSEAHSALTGFILTSQMAGRRLVLVITGKGRGPAAESRPRGALRRQVPHWLRMAPTGPAVLDVSEAHLRHGGAGALYVHLRKRR